MPLSTGSSSIFTTFCGGVELSDLVSSLGDTDANVDPFSLGEGIRNTIGVSVAAGEEGDSFEGFVPFDITGEVSSRLKGELVAELEMRGLLASGPLDPHDAVDEAVDIP